MKQELQTPSSLDKLIPQHQKHNDTKIQSAETSLKIQVILCYKFTKCRTVNPYCLFTMYK